MPSIDWGDVPIDPGEQRELDVCVGALPSTWQIDVAGEQGSGLFFVTVQGSGFIASKGFEAGEWQRVRTFLLAVQKRQAP